MGVSASGMNPFLMETPHDSNVPPSVLGNNLLGQLLYDCSGRGVDGLEYISGFSL